MLDGWKVHAFFFIFFLDKMKIVLKCIMCIVVSSKHMFSFIFLSDDTLKTETYSFD